MKKSRVLTDSEQAAQKNLKHIWLAKKGELGLSQERAAALAGWKTQSAFNQFLNGGVALNTDAVIRLAKVLQVRPEEINPEIASFLPPNTEPGPALRDQVPLISWVQAGDWCEAHDPYVAGDAEKWLQVPSSHGGRAYALRVRGQSMEPRFREGEIIVVDPDSPADSGRFVIAKKTGSQEVTFKQLIREGGDAYLKAINPQWPEPIIRLTEEWAICGAIICKMEIF